MKKLFLVLVSLFSISCYTTVRTPYRDSRGDGEAAYAQSLMRNAVKFEETDSVRVTSAMVPGMVVTTDMTVVGSGVIVDVDEDENRSLILTAFHVCDTYRVGYKTQDMLASYEIMSSHQVVLTIDNKPLELKKIYTNKDRDICVVSVDHTFDSHAVMASKMPPRGAFVDVVGAPMGIWGDHLVSMQTGRYFGLTEISLVVGNEDTYATDFDNYAYYGFAGVGGFSGSGIYYDGRLVGLHTAGSGRFEHSSYGPNVQDLIGAVKKAKEVLSN